MDHRSQVLASEIWDYCETICSFLPFKDAAARREEPPLIKSLFCKGKACSRLLIDSHRIRLVVAFSGKAATYITIDDCDWDGFWPRGRCRGHNRKPFAHHAPSRHSFTQSSPTIT